MLPKNYSVQADAVAEARKEAKKSCCEMPCVYDEDDSQLVNVEEIEKPIEVESLVQQLMNSAFEKWDKKNISYDDFLDLISDLEREAVIFGNFNYQVENGGHSQWIGNGYASSTIDDLIEFLKKTINTEISNLVADNLEREVVSFVVKKEMKGCFDSYYEQEKCCNCDGSGIVENGYHGYDDDDEDDRDDDDYEYCEDCDGTGTYENRPDQDMIEKIDKEYYKINNELMEEINEYFMKKMN